MRILCSLTVARIVQRRSEPLPKHQFVKTKTGGISHLFCFGGGRGIRTPVGLPPNGFQDRLVMTASICLRVKIFSFIRFSRLVPILKNIVAPRASSSRLRRSLFLVLASQKRYSIVFTRSPVMTASICLRVIPDYYSTSNGKCQYLKRKIF